MSLRALERPAAGEPEGALVLFHGRGADEHDLFPLLDALDPDQRLQGYTPRGPLALPPGGAHWYVVPRVGYPDAESFHLGYSAAADWRDALPFPAERIVLGGFSADLTPPFPPIAIVHGEYDPVIPVDFARRARTVLEEAGAEPLYRELPIEHWIDPAVLPELRQQVVEAVRSA